MTPNQLTDDVTDGDNTCLISGDVIYFVDRFGNIAPTTRQCTRNNCHFFLNDKDPQSPFNGYICAQQGGACRCADLVADLDGSSHLRPRRSPYVIAADSGDYLLVAVSTSTSTTSSLTPYATNGDLHVGPNGGERPLNLPAGRAPRSDLPPGDE